MFHHPGYSDGVEPRRHPSALHSSNQLTAQGCRSALKAQWVTFKGIYLQKKATENTSVCFQLAAENQPPLCFHSPNNKLLYLHKFVKTMTCFRLWDVPSEASGLSLSPNEKRGSLIVKWTTSSASNKTGTRQRLYYANRRLHFVEHQTSEPSDVTTRGGCRCFAGVVVRTVCSSESSKKKLENRERD